MERHPTARVAGVDWLARVLRAHGTTHSSWFAIQGNGEANLTLSVPNAPVFVDLPIFAQAACWDLLTSHITTSNLLAGRIGVP